MAWNFFFLKMVVWKVHTFHGDNAVSIPGLRSFISCRDKNNRKIMYIPFDNSKCKPMEEIRK